MKRGLILFGTVVVLLIVALIPTIILPTLVSVFSGILPMGFLLTIHPLWWGLLWVFIAFLLVYFVLAPYNIFFTFVHEGTAKFVVRGDKFAKCLMEWQEHTFNRQEADIKKWEVIKGKPSVLRRFFGAIFGGLRFYGLWPIWDILVYEFIWTGSTERGEPITKEELIDYIFLKEDIYLVKVTKAEDKDLLPLEIHLLLTIRIMNPYKAKFRIHKWLETIINRIQPFIRSLVAEGEFADLHENTGVLQEKIKKELKDEKVLIGEDGEFYKEYGVLVREIEVRQIDPPDDLRKTTLLNYTAKREKEATITNADAEAQAIERVAEAKAKEIDLTFGAIQGFGEQGFLLEISKMAKEGNVPASVITHYLAGRFSKVLDDKGTMTSEEFRSFIKSLIEEFTQLAEVAEKL